MRLILGALVWVWIAWAAGCSAPPPTPPPADTPRPAPTFLAPTAPPRSATQVLPTPTFTPRPSPTALPITLTPTPTPTPAASTLLETLIKPFAAEAQKRRTARAKSDPEHLHRVEHELNDGRINFLLFGYGETHEPPLPKAIIGSHSILSYNTRTGTFDIISLTHDVRAPEIERAFDAGTTRTIWRAKQSYEKIDQVYEVGGFDLMRRTIEDATGLSVDFQIAFQDGLIPDVIDSVFGGIQVDVPKEFAVGASYLNGKQYYGEWFAQGKQKLTGAQAIQFMKALLVGDADVTLERNQRKVIIFRGLLDSANKNCADRQFWLRAAAFLVGELKASRIAYDFDPVALFVNNLGEIITGAGNVLASKGSCELGASKIAKTIYIVDPSVGDGGVQWVSANAASNPITRRDLERGLYPGDGWGVEIPFDANPYGDLVTEYWGSVRALIKQKLASPPP